MREFNNPKERAYLELLSEMSKNPELNLGNFVAKCILNKDRAVEIRNDEIIFFLKFTNDNEHVFINDLSGLTSLIEILKKDKLLFTHSNPRILQNKLTDISSDHSEPHNGRIALCLTNDDQFKVKILQSPSDYRQWVLPTTLSIYVPEYVNQFCYVRPELIDYIDNRFRTPEQLRFIQTICWTRIAAIISFMGLLIALWRA